jgi:hypothetical protein
LHQEEKIFFSLLKRDITTIMMQSYPGIDPEISNWKGQEIIEFQEDLRIKVNGQLSEKWFYTHMKVQSQALPRIDVLNMLSQYAGYLNWQDFRHKNKGKLLLIEKRGTLISKTLKIPLLLISVITLVFIIMKMINTQNYRFIFIDSDTGEPVPSINLRAELLSDNESPVTINPDEKGIITVRTKKNQIKLIVKVPYYLTDTIIRTLWKFNNSELISLHADYYALMINYFSRSDVISWEKRRKQLNEIFSEDAIIYQFPDERKDMGMAIYNKQEFIDKITIPTSGLRKIDILDCRYINGKIALMRFRIKIDEE